MIRVLILPLLALVGVLSAVRVVLAGSDPVVPAPPVSEPWQSPFVDTIAGAGIVESRTENISVAAPVSGIVETVEVRTGQQVAAGDVLFIVDRRALLAARESARATIGLAEAEVKAAEVSMRDAETQWRRASELSKSRVISSDEADKLRFAAERSVALLAAAKAKVVASQAELGRVEADLERSVVRAPIAGTILKVSARPGEYAGSSGPGGDPLVLIGDTEELYVRVDVDENDAWRVRRGSHGIAVIRGNKDLRTAIEFVRFEPYVIPKRSLTGASSERTDTRVLQVIFRMENKSLPIFVGQQMDIFIDGGEGAKKL